MDFRSVQFDETNPATRVPCVLLLDTSSSMEGNSIAELNQALQLFASYLASDTQFQMELDVSIITFGPIEQHGDFVEGSAFVAPTLSASGDTPMASAVLFALDKLQARKDFYMSKRVNYHQPWLVLITDGAPSDMHAIPDAAKRIHELEGAKKLVFIAAGTDGADFETLKKLSVRPVVTAKASNLEWLSQSLNIKSFSRPGEQTALPPLDPMTTYCDEGGRPITLGKRLGNGGEAGVFEVVGASRAAKIYTGLKAAEVAEKRAKVNTMLAMAPADPDSAQNHVSIAWPTSLLYYTTGAFAGFLMPSVEAVGTLRVTSNPSARRLRELSEFTSTYLHRIAANVCHAVAAIHDVGHVIGDLNPNNVLINRQGLATLIDTDSYQITDKSGRVFLSGVGVPEYLAPERAQGGTELTREQDYFTLTILIFEMMMGGFHPYAGGTIVGVQSTSQLATGEYLKQGLFPFAKNAAAAPPDGAPDFQLLHPELRDAFMRTFLHGHATPNLRLAPREWAALVRRVEYDLAPCPKNPEHYFYRSVGTCMWCEQEARISRSRGGTQ
jgi:uncharacterized protein YegL